MKRVCLSEKSNGDDGRCDDGNVCDVDDVLRRLPSVSRNDVAVVQKDAGTACLHHCGQVFPFNSRDDCRREQTRKRTLAFSKLMAPPQTSRFLPAAADKVSHTSFSVRARLHSILYSVGDCVFLLVIGAVAAMAMRLIDSLSWNAVLSWVVGMVLAMTAQTILAFAATPLLGSIETMVPSMVLAMLCPMSLDLLEMIGADLGWSWSIGFGTGLGLTMFLFVEIYGVRCRKSLHRLGVRR